MVVRLSELVAYEFGISAAGTPDALEKLGIGLVSSDRCEVVSPRKSVGQNDHSWVVLDLEPGDEVLQDLHPAGLPPGGERLCLEVLEGVMVRVHRDLAPLEVTSPYLEAMSDGQGLSLVGGIAALGRVLFLALVGDELEACARVLEEYPLDRKLRSVSQCVALEVRHGRGLCSHRDCEAERPLKTASSESTAP